VRPRAVIEHEAPAAAGRKAKAEALHLSVPQDRRSARGGERFAGYGIGQASRVCGGHGASRVNNESTHLVAKFGVRCRLVSEGFAGFLRRHNNLRLLCQNRPEKSIHKIYCQNRLIT
jgi:hypothetical protein